jgi:hypothetical protein
VNLLLRELQDDINDLRSFVNINSNNEIGQRVGRVMEFAESKLKEEREKELRMMESIEKANKPFVTENIVKLPE